MIAPNWKLSNFEKYGPEQHGLTYVQTTESVNVYVFQRRHLADHESDLTSLNLKTLVNMTYLCLNLDT